MAKRSFLQKVFSPTKKEAEAAAVAGVVAFALMVYMARNISYVRFTDPLASSL